jgi:hypothetical protein
MSALAMIARTVAVQLAVAGALVCAPPQSRDDSKSTAKPEIHGVLLEFGTLQPITGAEVSYWTMPAPGRPMSFPADKTLGKTTTDGAGAFRFLPGENGNYYVLAKKEGYGRAPSAGLSMAASIRLTEERPVREVQLMLARPGWITGRVVDEDTGRPVAKLRLFATESRYTNGRRMLIPTGASTTDADGRFTAAVAPADYLVQLNPRASAGAPSPLLTAFSEDDLRKVDMDYGETYWPGGHEASTALPVMVASHDRLDLGTLRIRKTPLYRARFSFPPAACHPGEETFVYLSSDALGGMQELGQVPCGKDLLLRGLAPGTYQMEFVIGRGQNDLASAKVTLRVADENLDIPVLFGRGVDIEGRIVAAEGALKPPLDKLRVVLSPVVPDSWSLGIPIAPDAEGRFRIENARLTEQRLEVQGVPASHYVQEVRYNGSAARGGILDLSAGAMAHSLEIVIDDKPAALAGSVVDNDRPVDRPFVVLAHWPISGPRTPGAMGDEDGKFQFAGLAPGLYRVVAIPSASKDRLDRPNILERLLAGAKEVTLGPGNFQTVTLELTELR